MTKKAITTEWRAFGPLFVTSDPNKAFLGSLYLVLYFKDYIKINI